MKNTADQAVYEFEYKPTVKEIRQGTGLMSKGMYPGIWLRLCQLHGIILGASFGVTGIVTSFFLFKASGVPIHEVPLAFILIGLVIGLALMLSGRIWHNHSINAYHAHTAELNQSMRLSHAGLEIISEHMNLSYGWASFRVIEQNKVMTTLLLGNTGFILPNRLLEQAGDIAEISEAIRAWFDARAQVRA
ncbi:MAG: hypothetical protein WBC85_03140 [Planktotalea sp.]|uniref:hypothetical protein n=1 Tax=Planktotalea sp. TaxID=2029877 RepID=UPI003C762A31